MKFSAFGKHVLAAALAAGGGLNAAQAAEGQLADAIGLTKPLLDMRLRYEYVDQAPLTHEANAVTLRTRAGFETGKAWGTSLLAEIEWVAPLTSGGYNSTINGKTQYPTVADPKALGINRLYLTNITLLPATAITLGRQRINLEDQRFVGNVGWRQNEQTYDSLRIVSRPATGFTVDVAYVNQINRVFGNFSPQGKWTGDSYLLNAAYQFGLGKLTAFGYLLDFEQPAAIRDASQTYGMRFAGGAPVGTARINYAASYAVQRDNALNPLNYKAHYYLAEGSVVYMQYTLGAGYEVLSGNGVKGFTTPLATLHKFNGWADKFLATPPNGLTDLYVTAAYNRPNVGPFATIGAQIAYHSYDSDRLSLDYGDEINAQLQAKWDRYMFTLKFADYDAHAFATDTQKLWFQVEFAL